MTHMLLSRLARKYLLTLKDTKQKQRLIQALREITASPFTCANITSLSGVPNGYRRRVGRHRILFTFHAKENLLRVWIIDLEKDTRKDYARWMEYILRQL